MRLAVAILRPPLLLLTRRDWQGAQHLPPEGGVVLVTNHISHVDPLAFAHFVYDNGRYPRFLAKAGLFEVFFVGRVLRGAGQIPVYRGGTSAAQAYRDAVAAVGRGECVIVYPESTITRDPDLWPMVGKTGAARIALSTGAPVVPVAQWGAQDVLWPYTKRPHVLPRKLMRFRAGPPVDLGEFAGRPLDTALLRGASEAIMAAVTSELEVLREETAPPTRYDPRTSGGEPGDAGPERSTA